jgi:hypothetical protein
MMAQGVGCSVHGFDQVLGRTVISQGQTGSQAHPVGDMLSMRNSA